MHKTPFRLPLTASLALGLALTAHAGEVPVSPSMPVFVPSVVATPTAPVFVPPGVGGAAKQGAAASTPEKAKQQLTEATTANNASTTAIVNAFNQATAFCGSLTQQEYVIDCFADEYDRIQAALPDTGDYAPVKETVAAASSKLAALARSERSRTRRPGVASRAGAEPRRTSRALIPVRTESLPQTADRAARIVEETRTVLLRSTENSDLRRRQFQRIAEAMSGGALLLRSL